MSITSYNENDEDSSLKDENRYNRCGTRVSRIGMVDQETDKTRLMQYIKSYFYIGTPWAKWY